MRFSHSAEVRFHQDIAPFHGPLLSSSEVPACFDTGMETVRTQFRNSALTRFASAPSGNAIPNHRPNVTMVGEPSFG